MRKFCIGLILATAFFNQMPLARAESQAACSIWLCLPGGFPTGCAAAYSEFKHRIKKGKPPLPSLSSCTTGPDGKSSNGRYELGAEYFMPCKDGFRIDQNMFYDSGRGICKPIAFECSSHENYRQDENADCISYEAIKRINTQYVKMWVDENYLGQFFYQ